MNRFILRTALLTLCCTCAHTGRSQIVGWADAIDAAGDRPELAAATAALVEQARKEVQLGLVRRAYHLEDIGQHRTWLDGRSEALEDEIREDFALAMSDFGACNHLASALPTVAAAARLSGDAALSRHVIAQLREMSHWRPLQRPGWSLYRPGNRLGPDGKDGSWLATGCGVRAIVTTLDIMGDRVPPDVRAAFQPLLEAEIDAVVDDWKTKRPWFVRTDDAVSNQWVLPTEGLVRACLFLGRDRHRDAYELGVHNLLKALSAHGREGEFEEGIGYATFTITSLYHTARAMAAAGDRRAIDHPFLAAYPTWAVHHIQPGRMAVNCFDAGNGRIPRDDQGWRSALSLLVFAGQSAVANWALWEQFDGPNNGLIGLLARGAGAKLPRTEPALLKVYQRAPMVVWRDSWQDDANGVWVRGGHRLDSHDHQDRGHVNCIAHGRPILIEAGTPSYSNPDMGVRYASGAGHNVLQLGTFFPARPFPVQTTAEYAGWQRPHAIAPITVERLAPDGGSVTVSAGDGYTDAARWERHVQWDRTRLTVQDEVTLVAAKKEIVLFRWHLGTNKPVDLAGTKDAMTLSWPAATMTLEADQPLKIEQGSAPDSTLTGSDDNQHTCIQVQSRSAVHAIRINTTVEPTKRFNRQPGRP